MVFLQTVGIMAAAACVAPTESLACPITHPSIQCQSVPAPLTLEDVLSSAQISHPKLIGAIAERDAAFAEAEAKRGSFDPLTFVGGDFQRFNSTSTRGKTVTSTTTAAGVELTLRSGIKLTAGVNRNVGAVKAPLSNSGEGGEFFLTAKIPLLRGRGINEKGATEQQALLGIPLASTGYDTTRLGVLLAAATSYWEWAAAGRKLFITRDLLRIAEERAGQVRRRADRGDLPAIDAVEADQEVQRRRGALVKAERDLQKAALKLGLYLWQPNGVPGTVPHPARVPNALPEPVPLGADAIAMAKKQARAARPELAANELSRRIAAVDRRLAANDLRPDVSLTVGPGADVGRLGVGETLKAGAAFVIPLNRWDAAGRRDEADAKLRKLNADRTLLERAIEIEVEDAASAVNAAEERFRTAQAEIELAERLEQGERTRFALGEGNLFLVNQRERATAEARARLIEVNAEYHQALAAFHAAAAQL